MKKNSNLGLITFLLGLMAFLVNGDNYAAAPVLINIAEDFAVRIDIAALSVTSYMLMFGFMTIVIGPVSDRIGKSGVIILSALGTSLFSIICVFSGNIRMLIILRALNGVFASGILPVSVALVGELSELDKQQNSIGKVMSLMFLGGAIATSIGGALAFFGSWKLVYLVYGIAELMLTALVFKHLRNVKTSRNNGNIFQLYRKALSNHSLTGVLILLFLMGYCVFGSFVYTGKLIENISGFNVLFIGLILSLFGFGSVMAGRKSGSIRQSSGRLFFPVTGLMAFLSVLALALTDSLLIISLCLFIFGAVFILFQSTFITQAQSILPGIRGTAMSLASFSVVIGGSVGTVINGRLLDLYGIKMIYLVSSLLLAITAVLAFFLFRQLKTD